MNDLQQSEKDLRQDHRTFWLRTSPVDGKTVRYNSDDPPGSSVKEGLAGFCSLGEAEVIATRRYTQDTKEPTHCLLRGKKIAFLEKGRAEFLEMLQKDGFSLFHRDYSPPDREGPTAILLDATVWVGPNGVLTLAAGSDEDPSKDHADTLVFTSTDPELLKKYSRWWAAQAFDSTKGKVSSARISGIFQAKHGPTIRQFAEPIGFPLEPKNYNPAVVDFYNKVKEELASRAPSGRLVLLDGPPGTGKTFVLRGLVHDLAKKAEFIYLPASMVQDMDGPSMISLLDREEQLTELDAVLPKVLIIEDADECLISRAADNISSIRNLLNFCDGFLGALLDIRIIATTNSGHIGKTDKIDGALLRAGRLLARSTVGMFTPELASERICQLTGKTDIKVEKPMTLAEIYALAHENGWKSSSE